ncbi:MAG: ABC transporter permease [Planctomycetota bacterium]|jgi:putative ABC transport system permease protein
MRILFQAPLVFLRLLYQSAYLALGQIWANKTRSILTTLGIVIGVASVTAVIAALTGMKTKILSQVETFGTNTIMIQPWLSTEEKFSNIAFWTLRFTPEQLDGMLEHCPSVARFSKVAGGGQQTVKYGERSVRNVEVSGLEPDWHEIENRPILFGRKFSVIDQDRNVCLIEPNLRDKLRMDKDCIGESIRIGHNSFRVIGVIEQQTLFGMAGGGQESYEVLIPFRMTYKFGKWIWIWAIAEGKSTETLDEAVAEVKFFLRRTRRIKPGNPDTFIVQDLKTAIKTFNQIALAVTLVAVGIVGISLVVGGVGIMNIMLVSISERTREIGLRKAVGAKKTAILTQFLVEAVILCFFGGLIGLSIGQLLTFGISKINPVLDQTHIPAWAIALSFCFAGTVGICFGMFPAIKAARLDPIEALRHE